MANEKSKQNSINIYLRAENIITYIFCSFEVNLMDRGITTNIRLFAFEK